MNSNKRRTPNKRRCPREFFPPPGFGPPGPNPLADLVPHGGPNLQADLVSPRGFGPLYFRDIQNYKKLTRVNIFSFEGQTMSLR